MGFSGHRVGSAWQSSEDGDTHSRASSIPASGSRSAADPPAAPSALWQLPLPPAIPFFFYKTNPSASPGSSSRTSPLSSTTALAPSPQHPHTLKIHWSSSSQVFFPFKHTALRNATPSMSPESWEGALQRTRAVPTSTTCLPQCQHIPAGVFLSQPWEQALCSLPAAQHSVLCQPPASKPQQSPNPFWFFQQESHLC